MSGEPPVRVEESAARGRDLVADEPLPAGRTVLTVAPLAAVPSDAFMLTVCCGCLQHCPSSRRCVGCGTVLLCEACGETGHRNRELHDDECASLRQLRTDPSLRQHGAAAAAVPVLPSPFVIPGSASLHRARSENGAPLARQ